MMPRINVTKTFLPPIEEYEEYLRDIWDSDWITNQGPLLQRFEQAMRERYGYPYFHFVSNGTIALQLALKALDITEGEIITTPFTYVATTSSILWERCMPVFVDIDSETLCIDPKKIEAAITPNTKAIMPVHVFGNPCDVEAINAVAKKHGLKVIYDAAHAFGVKYKGESLMNYGDISICSFHATKLFHTIEGGSLVAKDAKTSETIEMIKRFGHNGDDHRMLGINAKATEFQAAMGLVNLRYIDAIIARRKSVTEQYDARLAGVVKRPLVRKGTEYNFAYYPIILKNSGELQKVMKALNDQNIFPRRYFYPSLNKLPYLKTQTTLEVSESISGRILCLPFHDGLDVETINIISDIVVQCVN